ncbi:glycosyl hydrolase family 76 protein [Penicillium hispanicum]|uniref:glycosyl hydrolase family 76 protein n=1 Tax=Penicillium hispanicum TaxID=1080232 RepID=UPI00253F7498|nr:glycosyl hydrolase family 76 protein [Penicillium hispanicum]KAJ5594488.1 glycosyl hydrolase family 76 protein [Penicillium hispanicum]
MVGGNWKAAAAVTLVVGAASAIDLDITDEQSLKNAAATAAFNTMSNYTANQTGQAPGALPSIWWEGGALFDILIQYWAWTGDASNNPAVSQGMYWQRGSGDDYMPRNYSSYLGNDDQVTWGLAAMTAAEMGFPQQDSMPSWLTLAENVFNAMSARWDDRHCGGGLRWQIWPYQAGYTNKNALTNGGFFELAARLARYTNNETYSSWAEKTWNWSTNVSLINTDRWTVADSTSVSDNCANLGYLQWSLNYGAYITGAAYMYNLTDGKTSMWKSGLDGLLNTSFTNFFPEKYGGKIMSEVTCESQDLCNRNEELFKGLFAQDLSFVTLLAPHTASDILPRLQDSAIGAAKQCSGGTNNTLCGLHWYKDTWDGTSSREEQLIATSLFTANLVTFDHKALQTQSSLANTTTSSTAGGSQTKTSSSASGTSSSASGTSSNAAVRLSSSLFVLAAVISVGVFVIA